MVVYGLTGGVATGKTTVSQIFQEHSIPVIDADLIAREVVRPGESAYKQLRAEFGSEYFDDENGGELIREKLGKLIFYDSKQRKRLNRITHPAIRWRMFYQFIYYFFTTTSYVILDTPLLFEVGYDKFLGTTIVVWCDGDKELTRLMKRDQSTLADAKSRIASQMCIEEKKKRATIVLDNNGSKEELREQVEELIRKLNSSWTPLLCRLAVPGIIAGLTYGFVKFLKMF
ncbi:unnamed protein product [Auanema sp. JU1783]|nr:unnamed protein product [Auanema sp. JU1783]